MTHTFHQDAVWHGCFQPGPDRIVYPQPWLRRRHSQARHNSKPITASRFFMRSNTASPIASTTGTRPTNAVIILFSCSLGHRIQMHKFLSEATSVDSSISTEYFLPRASVISSNSNAGEITSVIRREHFVRCSLIFSSLHPIALREIISPKWSTATIVLWQVIAAASSSSLFLTSSLTAGADFRRTSDRVKEAAPTRFTYGLLTLSELPGWML